MGVIDTDQLDAMRLAILNTHPFNTQLDTPLPAVKGTTRLQVSEYIKALSKALSSLGSTYIQLYTCLRDVSIRLTMPDTPYAYKYIWVHPFSRTTITTANNALYYMDIGHSTAAILATVREANKILCTDYQCTRCKHLTSYSSCRLGLDRAPNCSSLEVLDSIKLVEQCSSCHYCTTDSPLYCGRGLEPVIGCIHHKNRHILKEVTACSL